MTNQLKRYIKTEAIISAIINFIINGMIAFLIYHKVVYVTLDIISIFIDLLLTCLLIFIISTLFCQASLKRTKTLGLFKSNSGLIHKLSSLFKNPLLYGLVLGTLTAIILSLLISLLSAILSVYSIPFEWYVVFKAIFTALLGGGITVLTLYTGIHSLKK